MKHLEYIDDYFKAADKSLLSRQFDQKLQEDPSFAEEVAFYLTTVHVLKEQIKAEKLQRFRTIWQQQREQPVTAPKKAPVIRILAYSAIAAAVVGITLMITVWLLPGSKQQMADGYIQQRLNTLGVNMGGSVDSLQLSKDLYNQGKFAEARQLLEEMLKNNRKNLSALEFAGVTSLRLKQYDSALIQFKQLAAIRSYNNPGIFYQALTLMKRNKPDDLDTAKVLLQQVVKDNLAEKEMAREWLDKW